jgi:DNA-directed RNA polymerase subunit RPC12/RpoP
MEQEFMNEIKCPNCGSSNVVQTKAKLNKAGSIGLFIGIVTSFIFIGIFFIIAGIIALVQAHNKTENTYTCKVCQKEFQWSNTQSPERSN